MTASHQTAQATLRLLHEFSILVSCKKMGLRGYRLATLPHSKGARKVYVRTFCQRTSQSSASTGVGWYMLQLHAGSGLIYGGADPEVPCGLHQARAQLRRQRAWPQTVRCAQQLRQHIYSVRIRSRLCHFQGSDPCGSRSPARISKKRYFFMSEGIGVVDRWQQSRLELKVAAWAVVHSASCAADA
jgi:hypothetical protein